MAVVELPRAAAACGAVDSAGLGGAATPVEGGTTGVGAIKHPLLVRDQGEWRAISKTLGQATK
jgi:hypothetical protein